MRVVDALCVPGETGFFADDQSAIRSGVGSDGFLYTGAAVTPGFDAVRQRGESLLVLLVLEDGHVAQGDCATVQYSGVGGREPVFHAADAARVLRRGVLPELVGLEVGEDVVAVCAAVDAMVVDGEALPAALRYGLSQALLDAAAHACGVTVAELVAQQWSTGVPIAAVPVYVQCGDVRYTNVDKMILKRVDVLPHGLINTVAKLGADGEVLATYVRWLRERILAVAGDPAYRPVLHLDLYGTVGIIFGGDLERVADYLVRLGRLAAPFRLRVEHPVDAGSRDAQVTAFVALRALLAEQDPRVELVVDEWCNTLEDIEVFVEARAADVVHVKTPDLGGLGNTIEALLLVRRAGLLGFAGGTCNETDVSAKLSTQVAMACGAAQVLAKPGMGVDEGLMIVRNEMARTLALVGRRATAATATTTATTTTGVAR